MLTSNLVLAIKQTELSEEDQNNLGDLILLRNEFYLTGLAEEKYEQYEKLCEWFHHEFLIQ